jgi:hypothetical protein
MARGVSIIIAIVASTIYVIQAGPEFKVLGENLLDEFTMASPAIDRDSLIIRTAGSLYRISEGSAGL